MIKTISKNVLKNIDWGGHLLKLYRDALKPELQRYVESTDYKIDDVVLKELDGILEKLFQEEKQEDAS